MTEANYKDTQKTRANLFTEAEITAQEAQKFIDFLSPYADTLKRISDDLQQTLYVLSQAPDDIYCDTADACTWTLDTVNALENLYPVFRDKAGCFLSQFATAHFNIDDVIPYQADTKLRFFNMEAQS